MKLKGVIDSLSLRSEEIETLFSSKDYIIETAKSVGVFEPKIWRDYFKKPFNKSIIEAKILHTSTGLTIALKRYNRSPTKQSLDIAGLQGYDDKSKLLKMFFDAHFLDFMECEIKRIDVCIDFVKVPNRVIKKLCEKREPSARWNTTYFKTQSENKTNAVLDIKLYSKQKEAKLSSPMMRLEFCFKGAYFSKGMKLNNLDAKFLLKMEKSILGFSGLNVKIEPLK